METYYKVDSRRLTYRDCWELTRSWKVFFAYLQKLTGTPLTMATGIPVPDRANFNYGDFSILPPHLRQTIEPAVHICESLGFSLVECHVSNGRSLLANKGGAASLWHNSREILGSVVYVPPTIPRPGEPRCTTIFSTWLRDGTILVTSNTRRGFAPLPERATVRLETADPRAVFECHQKRLVAMRNRNPPSPIYTREEVDRRFDELEDRSFRYHVERGVYVPMTDAEVAAARQRVAAEPPEPAAPPRTETPPPLPTLPLDGQQPPPSSPASIELDVLHEQIQKLNQVPVNWGKTILMFGISLLIFVGLGSYQWSGLRLVLIVLVLLFHELGHYLTMRTFGYQDLKMFFIPLFGAAVSGTSRTAPGWKRAVVSLMGPAPGILLGTVIFLGGFYKLNPALYQTAFLLVILNAFNLLPVMPLDGGRFWTAVVFGRNRWLEALFTVACATVLTWFAATRQSWLFSVLAWVVLMMAFRSFKLATVVQNVRDRYAAAVLPVTEEIPRDLLALIVEELKLTMTSRAEQQRLAKNVVEVYSKLNTVSPDAGTASALVVSYLFVVAVAGFGLYGPFHRMLPRQAIGAPPLSSTAEMMSRRLCLANLQTVAAGLKLYTDTYQGRLPLQLAQLTNCPGYNLRPLVCSSHWHGHPPPDLWTNSYDYFGAFGTTDMPANSVLVADRYLHPAILNLPAGRNVITADLQAHFMEEHDLSSLQLQGAR